MIRRMKKASASTAVADPTKPSRTQAARLHAKKHAERIRVSAKKVSNLLTQSKAFRTLVDWAYHVCDPKRTNHITADQLYGGLLLVHLNLARFCGSAACMPPSRDVIQDLFEISDVDESGGIDREEFNIIIKVSCAQIFTRVLINYATLIFIIPLLAQILVDRWGIANGTYLELICEQCTGMFLFVVIVPFVWKRIDRGAHQEAGRQAERQRSDRNLMTANAAAAGAPLTTSSNSDDGVRDKKKD